MNTKHDATNGRITTTLNGPLVVWLSITVVVLTYFMSQQAIGSSAHGYSKHTHSLAVAGTVSSLILYFVSALNSYVRGRSRQGSLGIWEFLQFVMLIAAGCTAGAAAAAFVLSKPSALVQRDVSLSEWLTITFAALGLIASILDARVHEDGWLSRQGRAIDLPLFIGILLLVFGRVALFDKADFTAYADRKYIPSGVPNGYEETIRIVISDLRSGYWIGHSNGALAVQLVIAVLGSALLRWHREGQPAEGVR